MARFIDLPPDTNPTFDDIICTTDVGSISKQVTLADVRDKVIAGRQTLYIPASGMIPTASDGCASLASVETTAGRPDLNTLDFDASSDEHAQFQIALPDQWDEGTVTFQVYWSTAATDTDGVAWFLHGVATSDGDTLNVAYGTAVGVTDLCQTSSLDCLVTVESSTMVLAGAPASGDLCNLCIYRDVSDGVDTMSEDAQLIGLKLFITTNSTVDG